MFETTTTMENHNRKDTVVVDYKPYDVRIGRFPAP
jgi:hypothetical protein